MAIYSTNNSRINGDKLWLIFIITMPTLVYICVNEFDLFVNVFIIIALILIMAVLILWYRACYFIVDFNDTLIEQTFKYSQRRYCFAYVDLKEIHYYDSYNRRSINIIKVQKDGAIVSLKVNPVGYGEKYVSYIKWLKTRNPDFKTIIYPKGSTLHMRLRQELLKSEF